VVFDLTGLLIMMMSRLQLVRDTRVREIILR
jgi:hypothetical protein